MATLSDAERAALQGAAFEWGTATPGIEAIKAWPAVEAAVEAILTARLAKAEALALLSAADAIQALHPGEIKNSVVFLRERALASDPTAQLAKVDLSTICNEFSALLDDTYPPDLDVEAHRWRRVGKIAEEAGEVVEALLGCVSENPRKGASHTVDDVRKELLDVAFCALAARAHLDGNRGDVGSDLAKHAEATHTRLRAALASDPTHTQDGGRR